MKREPVRLENDEYDLLVIGAGIYGVFIAWDAALRGLRTALIDRDDIGGGTSANSLKIIHSGLRALSRGRLSQAYLMEQELQIWMHIAPHFIQPLPILMPFTGLNWFHRSKNRIGMGIFNLLRLVVANNKQGTDRLPFTDFLSSEDCLSLAPQIADAAQAGGTIWYDAQVQNTERLTLSVAKAAVQAGAAVVNYCEAIRPCIDGRQIVGVEARDRLTGDEININAKMVVNAAGPWLNKFLSSRIRAEEKPLFRPSLAFNLVTKQIMPELAYAFPSKLRFQNGQAHPRSQSRMLLCVPWRGHSLIGTEHLPIENGVTQPMVNEEMVVDFIDEVNGAFPSASLHLNDIFSVQSGLLPVENNENDTINLVLDSQVVDHQERHSIGGLLSVIGVKYSLARHTAELAVNQVMRKLGKGAKTCQTRNTVLPGGYLGGGEFNQVSTEKKVLDKSTMQRYHQIYGTETDQLIAYLDEYPFWGSPLHDDAPVTYAEVIHAARAEMALHLDDVVLRRIESGYPTRLKRDVLDRMADLMAKELGWSSTHRQREIESIFSAYQTATFGIGGVHNGANRTI